jgi:alkyl hydroperoxide reductase subunit F
MRGRSFEKDLNFGKSLAINKKQGGYMPKITIYSTATCAYCKMLKSYLQSKDVAYEEKHADQDHAIAQELYKESGQLGVPFTIISGDNGHEDRILGFDKPMIDQALGLAG